MKPKQNPKIAVSIKLKKKLDSLGKKGDTYEDIIWRLIFGIQTGKICLKRRI